MVVVRPRVVVRTMAACAVLGLGGCVTAKKYQLAKDNPSPAVPLNYTAEIPTLKLQLVSVIVYDGPGAWKQRALWDEYVVSLTNRGAGPLTIESAGLIDPVGEEQVPGAEPWELERLSESGWRRYNQAGQFVLGVGAYAGAVQLSAIGYAVAGGVASGIFFVMPAVLLADIAVVAVMNHNNRGQVEKEYERRRLKLPLTIVPGRSVTGSFFFPLVPAPQRLILRGKSGADPWELVLDLKPLASLHLKQAEGAVKPP
jgi:hypothetical protein